MKVFTTLVVCILAFCEKPLRPAGLLLIYDQNVVSGTGIKLD